MMNPNFHRPHADRGFSLVELLVTIAIAAGVITAGVLLYTAVISARSTADTSGSIPLGAQLYAQFYPQSQPNPIISAWFAPNYGLSSRAEELRALLLEDLKFSSAVFCLGRTGHVGFRATGITLPSGFDAASLDTPESFRQLLAVTHPTTSALFASYRGASLAANHSIYILEPSAATGELAIRSIYEMDQVPIAAAGGTYVTVRRYVGNTLSSFYDIFYPDGGGGVAFSPNLAAFERRVRLGVEEGVAIDSFKQAHDRPFYFVWWPDPAAKHLSGNVSLQTFPSSDPRSYYVEMGGRTSLFFVIPMFPSL